MNYSTTSASSVLLSFKESLFQGMGKDSTLIVPHSFPTIDSSQLIGKSIQEIGSILLAPFMEDVIDQHTLFSLLQRSVSFPIPLIKIGDNYILELFHGPTQSFKDVAAQFLGNLVEHLLKESDREMVITTATSGDTGGAVAEGFANKKNVRIVILFPKNGVSEVQRRQLTQVASNVFSIEVDGTFDDCQKYVKQFFTDKRLSTVDLTSANSINIGRLLPQMMYYAFAWSKLNTENLRFVVPSGNMGNVTAGLYAKRIGIPINQFHIACNANDPVHTYFETGEYTPQQTKRTISTAMDIGNPSNFERILHVCNHDLEILKKDISISSTSDEETIQTIKDVYRNHNYLLDPHTAVGWSAAQKTKIPHVSDVIISTASPSKFPKVIYERTGISGDKIEDISFTAKSPERSYKVGREYDAVADQVMTCLGLL